MSGWQSVVSEAAQRAAQAPVPVRRKAVAVIADTLGVMLAGGRRAQVRALAAALGARPGGEGAQVVTDGLPVAAPYAAALVNGTAGTWLELDEAADTGVHAGAHVLAAVLALAQDRHLPGDRLLLGFLAGYEATAALHGRYSLTYPVHPHAGLAGAGAAAGLAVMLGSDPLACARIAGTLALTPTWDACHDGSTARHAFAGTSAASAVQALLMSEAGFTGSPTALDTLYGSVAGCLTDPPRRPVPGGFHILRNSTKLHAACLTIHTAIDAVLALTHPHDDVPPVHVADIESIEVHTTTLVARVAGALPNGSELSRRFSLPHAVAVAAVHGRAGAGDFGDDEQAAHLAARVRVRIDPDLPQGPHDFPARLTVHTPQGTRTASVRHPRGHHTRPPDDALLRAKFAQLTEFLQHPGLYERLLDLEHVPDTSALLPPMPHAAPQDNMRT